MGLLKVSANASGYLHDLLVEMLADPANKKAGMAQLFQTLRARDCAIRVLYTVGYWLDINSLADVLQANAFHSTPPPLERVASPSDPARRHERAPLAGQDRQP